VLEAPGKIGGCVTASAALAVQKLSVAILGGGGGRERRAEREAEREAERGAESGGGGGLCRRRLLACAPTPTPTQ
jgi:hypothetical protein